MVHWCAVYALFLLQPINPDTDFVMKPVALKGSTWVDVKYTIKYEEDLAGNATLLNLTLVEVQFVCVCASYLLQAGIASS